MHKTNKAVFKKLWKIGVALSTVDRESKPVYIEGKKIPQCKYETGYCVAEDWNETRARWQCEKAMREKYKSDLVDVAFFNTEQVDESKVPEEYRNNPSKLMSIL